MRKVYRSPWILISALAVLGGCSHAELRQRVDAKVAQEASVNTRSELHAETLQLIKTAPGVSDAQKAELLRISKTAQTQSDQLVENSRKLRSVLIQDMVSPKYDEDEVELIKDRLRDLEDKRVSVLFDAVEQANLVLGHDAHNHSQLVRSFVSGPSANRMD